MYFKEIENTIVQNSNEIVGEWGSPPLLALKRGETQGRGDIPPSCVKSVTVIHLEYYTLIFLFCLSFSLCGNSCCTQNDQDKNRLKSLTYSLNSNSNSNPHLPIYLFVTISISSHPVFSDYFIYF